MGGIAAVNSPVATSTFGSWAAVFSVEPFAASNAWGESTPVTSWRELARGVTFFVMRVDSSELGPDFTEFTSNAVTA